MENSAKKPIFRDSFKALGTDINLTLILDNGEELEAAKKISEELRQFYKEKELVFSRFNPDSELSKLNRNLNQFQKASFDIINLAKSSLYFHKKTKGYFDPRILETLENIGYGKTFKDSDFIINKESKNPKSLTNKLDEDLKIRVNEIFLGNRVDFSGIAKGYITDQVSLLLKSKGRGNFLLNSGGDMFASGSDQFGEKWKISVEGIPEERFYFNIQNQAVATSGVTRRKWEKNGKRYHHLINPMNPRAFLFDLKSVTVIAKTTEEADVLAKTLFLMGKKEGLNFSSKEKIKSIFLDRGGNLFLSSNFSGQ
ncbi:MAG: FAD:protein FMN transferase [bacterium]|nr:FAD:protein FMN transferase [bacterium]